MLVDAVNDFNEVHIGVLSDIAFVMEEKLLSYKNIVQSDFTRLSRILDPGFPNAIKQDKSFLRYYLQKEGIEVVPVAEHRINRTEEFFSSIFGEAESNGQGTDIDELDSYFQATHVKERARIDPLL